jgi:hypothetical protein
MGVEAARAAGTTMSYPLRGRDGELTSLHDLLARLRSGAGASWLIEGAPGLRQGERVRCRPRCGRAGRCGRRAGSADGRAVRRP